MTPAEIDAITCTMLPLDLARSAPLTARAHVETLTQMLATHPAIDPAEAERREKLIHAQKELLILAGHVQRTCREALEQARAQHTLSPAMITAIEEWHHYNHQQAAAMLSSIQQTREQMTGIDHAAVTRRVKEIARWLRVLEEDQP
jgi:hypothetical protein